MSEDYDLDKAVTITLSQGKMAVLMDICARIGDFGLSPEEEFVLREIEAAVEPEIDFIFDPGYRAIVADIKSKLRQELDPENALRAADEHSSQAHKR